MEGVTGNSPGRKRKEGRTELQHAIAAEGEEEGDSHDSSHERGLIFRVRHHIDGLIKVKILQAVVNAVENR